MCVLTSRPVRLLVVAAVLLVLPAAAAAGSETDQVRQALSRAAVLGRLFDDPAVTDQAADLVAEQLIDASGRLADGIAGPPPDPQEDRAGAASGPPADADAGGLLQPGAADRLVDATGDRHFEMDPDAATRLYRSVGGSARVGPDGFVCPVPEVTWFTHDWGFPRSGGRQHRGNDLFAPYGSPVVATAPATVVTARRVDRGLGGKVVSLLTDDGDVVYYAHLSALADGLRPGDRVRAGQRIGSVGTSGNARGTPPHLHLGIYPGGTDAVDPYPYTSVACTVGP